MLSVLQSDKQLLRVFIVKSNFTYYAHVKHVRPLNFACVYVLIVIQVVWILVLT